MLDVAGVASLSPCTPQPPNVTLCPSPAHTQSTRTPPQSIIIIPCTRSGDTELGTTGSPSGRWQSGREREETRELTTSANEGQSAWHSSPVRGMRAWGQRNLVGWGLGVCFCRTG